MQNPQILELIENLKGRRNYEEKKASKLGFNSLYAYFENKLLQEKNALEESAREQEIVKLRKNYQMKKKVSQRKLAAVVKFLNFLKTEIHQF